MSAVNSQDSTSTGDLLVNIPIAKNDPVNEADLLLLNAIFQSEEQVNNFMENIKNPLIGTFLFAICSSKMFDSFVNKANPKQWWHALIIKLIVYFVVFWLLQNRITSK